VIFGEKETDLTAPPRIGFPSRPRLRLLLSGAILMIVPIVFLVTVSQLTKARGPQWMSYTFENPYNYLFNSLLLVEGKSPPYIMHPGTTTQLFGSIILRTSIPKAPDELVEFTLRKPEPQLKKLHEALLIFTVLFLWMCPWVTALVLRNIFVGLLIQAPALFLQNFWWWAIQFGPELMLVGFSIAAVCCCVLLLVPSSVPERLEAFFGIRLGSTTPDSPRLLRVSVQLVPALTGLFCALGLATKLTFFPLILISLFCCWRRRNLVSFAIAFFLGLALALLPIYPQLPKLINWIFNVGIHSEKYGTGAVGLPQASVYLSTLSQFLQTEPMVAVIPSIAAIAVILLTFFPEPRSTAWRVSWRTVLPVFGLQLISYLAVLKQTELRYLIPLSISLGLSLVLLLYACQTRRSVISRAIGWLTLLALLFLGFKHFIEWAPKIYATLRVDTADQLRLYQHAVEITKNDIRVDYFFSDSPEYPLCNADNSVDNAFGPLLERLYPNRLFFDVYGHRFQTFANYIDVDAVLREHDHLYFLGNSEFLPKVDGFDPGTLETLDRAGPYSLQKWTRP
jgi:hypothetical protein